MFIYMYNFVSRDSSVGIATRYELEGTGSNPGGDEIFCTRSDRPWRPPSLLCIGYWDFPGGKAARAWR
jgi:8-oxo-dGTP pyrophosphatase MutT (NUDIX family)